MNRIKVNKNKDYTTISNIFLKDNNLSLKAKGFLAVIMSLDDNWDFTINGICSVLKEGKTSIYNTISELKEYGYCNYLTIRDEKGIITGNDYTFNEKPNMANPCVDNPYMEKPNVGNQPQLSTNTNKVNNKQNKEYTKKDDFFEECWKTYQRKGNKSKAYLYWKKLSETERANVQKHIPYYIKSVDNIKYIKDFERYLRDKIFESVVYKNGSIIYDPERIMDDNLYHPITDILGVFWSDNTKCYISSNMLGTQMFQDGYTNENRPNNSIIMYQGTRFHWNSEIKRWEENK